MKQQPWVGLDGRAHQKLKNGCGLWWSNLMREMTPMSNGQLLWRHGTTRKIRLDTLTRPGIFFSSPPGERWVSE